jgi:hypothetical protein
LPLGEQQGEREDRDADEHDHADERVCSEEDEDDGREDEQQEEPII